MTLTPTSSNLTLGLASVIPFLTSPLSAGAAWNSCPNVILALWVSKSFQALYSKSLNFLGFLSLTSLICSSSEGVGDGSIDWQKALVQSSSFNCWRGVAFFGFSITTSVSSRFLIIGRFPVYGAGRWPVARPVTG